MNTTMPKRTIEARDNSASVYMLTNGSAAMDASTLNNDNLHPFDGNSPPSKAADITKVFNVSQTGIVTWVISRDPYVEPSMPVVYGNASDGWNANTTYHFPANSTIDIVMAIAEDSMDKVSRCPRSKP